MIRVTLAVDGGYHVEVRTDASYSPDLVQDCCSRARELYAGALADAACIEADRAVTSARVPDTIAACKVDLNCAREDYYDAMARGDLAAADAAETRLNWLLDLFNHLPLQRRADV